MTRPSTLRYRLAAAAAAVLLGSAVLTAPAADKLPKAKTPKKKTPATMPGPDRPFNGKNLDGWVTKQHRKSKSQWTVGSARLSEAKPKEFAVSPKGSEMINAKGHGVDIYSKYVHGDAVIKLEVMVPKGSNSGVYVHGEYEIQVLDSYGRDKNPGRSDMGALYGAAPPTKPPPATPKTARATKPSTPTAPAP